MNSKEEKLKQANISHSPAIIEYSKTHSKDPLNYSLQKAAYRTTTCLIFIAFQYFLASKSKNILEKYCQNEYIFRIFHFLMQISMLNLLQHLIYYSLNLFSAIYKSNFPELIFVPTLLKNFSSYISIIIAWSLSIFTITFSTYKQKGYEFRFFELTFGDDIQENIAEANIQNIKNMTKGFSTSSTFHFLIPCIIKIYIVFCLRDFVTFILNYLIHYKYYEKRILDNTEKIALLKKINDTLKISYSVDIEEISKIVFETFSENSTQSIKLNDLKKYFDDATALKIFECCNEGENDEISKDEIYMFYISTLTEQSLLEKSICSNSSTVKSFKSVLDICVFLLSVVIILNYFPIIDIQNIESLKSPVFFLAAILSMNFSFGDAYRSFFNSLYFIFFIRPYEIGDYIAYNSSHYEVSEINLLTTILYDGSNFYVIPNSVISSAGIKNMRLNKIWKESFRLKFSYKDFNVKKDDFLNKLYEVMKVKATDYRKRPYYEQINFLGSDLVEVNLIVQINTSAASFSQIRERANSLTLKIKSILDELDLALK